MEAGRHLQSLTDIIMISRTLIALLIFAATLTGGSLAHAQATNTSTGTYTSGTTTTPGTPNTGAGGAAAANEIAVGVAAIVVGAGAIYLARRAALR